MEFHSSHFHSVPLLPRNIPASSALSPFWGKEQPLEYVSRPSHLPSKSSFLLVRTYRSRNARLSEQERAMSPHPWTLVVPSFHFTMNTELKERATTNKTGEEGTCTACQPPLHFPISGCILRKRQLLLNRKARSTTPSGILQGKGSTVDGFNCGQPATEQSRHNKRYEAKKWKQRLHESDRSPLMLH